jgi:hypothetical protein
MRQAIVKDLWENFRRRKFRRLTIALFNTGWSGVTEVLLIYAHHNFEQGKVNEITNVQWVRRAASRIVAFAAIAAAFTGKTIATGIWRSN